MISPGFTDMISPLTRFSGAQARNLPSGSFFLTVFGFILRRSLIFFSALPDAYSSRNAPILKRSITSIPSAGSSMVIAPIEAIVISIFSLKNSPPRS